MKKEKFTFNEESLNNIVKNWQKKHLYAVDGYDRDYAGFLMMNTEYEKESEEFDYDKLVKYAFSLKMRPAKAKQIVITEFEREFNF